MLFLYLIPNATLSEEAQPSQEMRVSDLSFSERLSLGTQLYQSGDKDSALKIFVELAGEESIPPSLRQESRVYIAEIYYVAGNKALAQEYFEQIIKSDPDYQIDRFRHPPDVCGLFDFVKTYQLPKKEPMQNLTTQPRPFPISGYSPFGFYHLQNKNTYRGFIYAGLQVGMLTTSITTYAMLTNDHTYIRGDTNKLSELDRRLLIQRTATFAFYSLWGISLFDAQRHWNLHLSVIPSDDGIEPAIGLEQRF